MPNSACSSAVIARRLSCRDVGDQQHVGAVGVELEPFGDILAQHRRREGPKALAILDLEIEVLLHRRRARIAEDRAGAERARAEFHAALKPADRLAVGERLRRRLDHVVVAEHGRSCARRASSRRSISSWREARARDSAPVMPSRAVRHVRGWSS